ncbi:MAG: FprA family A-type flavoprotein [Ignisphaera sp.]|nr:FprA family A-type flavoprotein [Ignisphaera sp.]MCX8167537.1 FprA family A-type flavoprotein [Ignisphaera sp.]MDW8086011.1 FprA family A-type flavoprotein [Ignisphaera sp.]
MSLKPQPIAGDVYWVGVNDDAKELFESLWPLPFGISYNAYAVVGRDTVALIDTVDKRYTYEYIGRIREVIEDFDRVRYIVVNHLEPDHHGATPDILKVMPKAKLVTSVMGSRILSSVYRVPSDRIFIVKDGDRIDLGGKTLRFIYTPWLHWPETMVTYLEEDRVLFSCDVFGSYGSLQDGIFDDEVDMNFYIDEARRYFSNIVIKYTRNVLEALEKLKGIEMRIIAPSHGPIYRSNPNRIVELYKRWAQSASERDRVLIIYGSMYGRGESIVEYIAEKLNREGLKISLHDVSTSHPSYILSDLVEACMAVFVYPSYDAGIFPYMEDVMRLLQLKQVGRGRFAAVVNTYAWGSTAKQAVELLTKAGFKVVEPVVETKAVPDEEGLKKIEALINSVVDVLKTGTAQPQ